MYEESEVEEQEEITKIYRKSLRKHRRRRHAADDLSSSKGGNSQPKTVLSTFIEGPKPRVSKADTERNRSKNSRDIYEGKDGRVYLRDPDNTKYQNGGFFLGECPYDDSEISVLKTKRIWKFKKTGRKGLDRFRRVVEFVKFARLLFVRSGPPSLSHQDSILFFLDTHAQHEEHLSTSQLFDVTPFKSLGQKSFVNSVRSVLEIPPQSRSENEVNSMLHLLRGFSKFSNYPQHIQEGLCRSGWYSKFERTKVIAKEGQRAEFYYLILTGVAVSRCLDTCIQSEDRRRQVAEFHRQGDTLGEKEILTNCDRPATFVCKEPLEVLGVDRETLLEIFKSAGGPDCIRYLRGIPDLQDFPLDLLQTSHFSCSVHKYRRGAVIVKNSNESEWIYVVKTGSCQVYKAIRNQTKKQSRGTSRPQYLQRQASDLNLPVINNKENLRSISLENIDKRCKNSNRLTKHYKKPTKQVGDIVLPSISQAKTQMVSMVISESTPREETSSKASQRRTAKTRSDKTPSFASSEGPPQYYAKLDIITEKECFGLHALLYDDTPELSLVSNGTECVLISKQFLRDNMDRNLRRRLQLKVPPYPDLSHLNNAVDDKVAWDTYKGKVLEETLR